MSKQLSRQQTRQTQRRERKEELRRRELARQAARRRRNLIIGSIVVCAVVIIGVLIAYNFFNNNKPTTTTATNSLYPPVNNIQCDSLEQTQFHIHAHLTIYIDGNQVSVPQNLGIASDGSCYYWLHTHDTTGVIHIEAPAANAGYTLGTFIKEWREVFTGSQYYIQLSATDGWTAYVDGKAYTSDFNDIKLASHELITLAYNSPNIKPDTTYNWTSDLPQ